MPARLADSPSMDFGSLAGLFESNDGQQRQANVEDQTRAVMKQFREQLSLIETWAGQYPVASKEFDMARKALNAALQTIVKNQPGPSQESPRVPA